MVSRFAQVFNTADFPQYIEQDTLNLNGLPDASTVDGASGRTRSERPAAVTSQLLLS
jgi:hypothetical protein